jgi:hypothetical protein
VISIVVSLAVIASIALRDAVSILIILIFMRILNGRGTWSKNAKLTRILGFQILGNNKKSHDEVTEKERIKPPTTALQSHLFHPVTTRPSLTTLLAKGAVPTFRPSRTEPPVFLCHLRISRNRKTTMTMMMMVIMMMIIIMIIIITIIITTITKKEQATTAAEKHRQQQEQQTHTQKKTLMQFILEYQRVE